MERKSPYFSFASSYLCKRFIAMPKMESQKMNNEQIKVYISGAYFYSLIEKKIVGCAFLDTEKGGKKLEIEEMFLPNEEFLLFGKKDQQSLCFEKKEYQLIHRIQNKKSNHIHLSIFKKENSVEQKEEEHTESFFYFLTLFSNQPHQILLVEYNEVWTKSKLQKLKQFQGSVLFPYLYEIQRYLSRLNSDLQHTDPRIITFLGLREDQQCIHCEKNSCTLASVPFSLHFISTILNYSKFSIGQAFPFASEKNQPSQTTSITKPIFFPPTAEISLPAHPFPSLSEFQIKSFDNIPKEIATVFESIIIEILRNPNQVLPHPNAELLDSEYDIIYRVAKLLSSREETQCLLRSLNRTKLAVLVCLSLQNMVKKNQIWKTDVHTFTCIYPHIFLIRFEPSHVEHFIHETLCEYAAFQLNPGLTSDPITSFQIKSTFDEAYPSFKGQTVNQLVQLCQNRAMLFKHPILLHNIHLIQNSNFLKDTIFKMVRLNLVSTNCKFVLNA